MDILRQAAHQALEAYNQHDPLGVVMADLRAALAQPEQDLQLVANFLKEYGLEVLEVIAALKTQPEQEPVAWINEHGHIDRGLDAILDPTGWTPLYTAPPQRKPLTEDEISEIAMDCSFVSESDTYFARAIEKAHGIE